MTQCSPNTNHEIMQIPELQGMSTTRKTTSLTTNNTKTMTSKELESKRWEILNHMNLRGSMSSWKFDYTRSQESQKNAMTQYKVKEAQMERGWTQGHQNVLARISKHLNQDEKNNPENWPRCFELKGASGAGKTEVIMQAAIQATKHNKSMLILCTTGKMLHAYEVD